MGTDHEVYLCQEEDRSGLVTLLASSFNLTEEHVRSWLENLGHRSFRVIRRGDRLIAGLGLVPAGQFFGGRSVPSWGVALVGVAPEWRGKGVGRVLMRKTLEELYAEGVPLSSLYPSTWTFYRQLGYERAGVHEAYEMAARDLHVGRTRHRVVPAGPADDGTIRMLYAERALAGSGQIDRTLPALWSAILGPEDRRHPAFLAIHDERPAGYLVYSHRPGTPTLTLRELCALDREACTSLLGLLARQATMFETLAWGGAPNDSILPVLPERGYVLKHRTEWMLRIVRVEEALAARGYPLGVEAQLHLDVSDDVCPWNEGRFVLTVEGGRGRIKRGGQGRLRLDVRDLAPLYSGHLAAQDLVRCGAIEGDEEAVAAAARAFAAPRPWMQDRF